MVKFLFPQPLLIIFSQILILQVISQVILLHQFQTIFLNSLWSLTFFLNPSPPKSNIYERDSNNFDQVNLILDYLVVDWADIIKSETKNIDFSFEWSLTEFNLILDKHLPLQKLTKWNEIQNQPLD